MKGHAMRKLLLIVALLPLRALGGDFVTNPSNTLFPDKVTGALCPYRFSAPAKCFTKDDANALKGAAIDLRAMLLADDARVGALEAGQGAGVVGYSTRAGLFADLAHPAASVGYVIGDSTASYNGVYVKSGASGSGSWTIQSARLDAWSVLPAGATVTRTLAARAADVVNSFDNGVVCDGSHDDTQGFNDSIAKLPVTGGTVFTPASASFCKTTTPIIVKSGLHFVGGGSGAANEDPVGGTEIRNSVTSVFANGATEINGLVLEKFAARSLTGGGHVIDFSGAGAATNVVIKDAVLKQDNPGKANVQATSANGVFGVTLEHVRYAYAAGNTVPALNFSNPWLSHIIIDHPTSYGPNTSSGTYSIRLEATTTGTIGSGCEIRNAVFEGPGGGAVDLLSMMHTKVDNARVWDLSVTPARPLFHLGKSATNATTGTILSTLSGIDSFSGTALVPDVQIDSMAGTGSIGIAESRISWLDGVAGGANGVTVTNSQIQHAENISYFITNNDAATYLQFQTTVPGSHSFALQHDNSNDVGTLKWLRDGAFSGGIDASGAWVFGGSASAPYAKLSGGLLDLTGVEAISAGPLYFNGRPTNGPAAIGYIFDTFATLSDPAARIASWRTGQGSERANINATGEYETLLAGYGILMKAPNGTRYRLSVSNAGALVIGTAP